ncbi:MAG TPA: type II toxin-antitoxin system prevent-host-death family antitoxin [Gammaproteobacteria bacterium]|nr:type II toxin-antitoxin system prevent-host-death family antitoxin [Gammaproteobacteria bacterium]
MRSHNESDVVTMNISVRELKSRLSAYLARARQGETLVITARRKPMARLGPLPAAEASGMAGVQWSRGKPVRFLESRGKVHLKGEPAAKAVLEDR